MPQFAEEIGMKPVDTSDKVLQLFQSFIKSSAEIDFETKLIEEGIVDSLTMVEFVDQLEQSFEIEFEAEDLTNEAFSSVSSIAALINKRKLKIG
ncbi:acyl carrier protein [bacterium]|nr:acyl carrier protein [bacterium]